MLKPWVFGASCAFLLSCQVATQVFGQATSTNTITLQAKLEGVTGPTVNLTVKFYDALIGGTQVGSTITLNAVPDQGGVVSVPVSPVDTTVFNGSTRYMGISVNGGAELSPRTLVTSVPYAVQAVSGGDSVGVFHLLGGNSRIEVNESFESGPQPKFGGGVYNSRTPWLRTLTRFASGDDHDYVARFEFSDAGLSDSGVQFVTKNGGNDFHLFKCYYAGLDRFLVDQSGNVFADGTISCKVLTIRGADVAEPFNIAKSDTLPESQPGMVVSIDPANPGKLVVCSTPYDTKVAGAISGAGGLSVGVVMGKDNADPLIKGDHPVAMSGRVYVWCDATTGEIKPGDRLTTSGTPGHAMKAVDPVRWDGAVIGKAMTELKEGKGLVLVLVNLQ